jgi:hypothetical protein
MWKSQFQTLLESGTHRYLYIDARLKRKTNRETVGIGCHTQVQIENHWKIHLLEEVTDSF